MINWTNLPPTPKKEWRETLSDVRLMELAAVHRHGEQAVKAAYERANVPKDKEPRHSQVLHAKFSALVSMVPPLSEGGLFRAAIYNPIGGKSKPAAPQAQLSAKPTPKPAIFEKHAPKATPAPTAKAPVPPKQPAQLSAQQCREVAAIAFGKPQAETIFSGYKSDETHRATLKRHLEHAKLSVPGLTTATTISAPVWTTEGQQAREKQKAINAFLEKHNN